MKKTLLLFLAIFAICTASYATEQKVNFIYVHGANQGPISEFQVCVDKMHPAMIKNLNNNEFIKTNMLQGASIDETPTILYWADKTHATKEGIRRGLAISKQYTPPVPEAVKDLLAELLHDSVWIQKYHNMYPVINDLHEEVMENYKQGKKTLLIGYSAGTFITYQYMLNKYNYINTVSFLDKQKSKLGFTKDDMILIKKYAPKRTCLSALIDSNMTVFNAEGNLAPSPDKAGQKERIMSLKRQTELSCAPDDEIVGVLNFASPLTVFYSEVIKQDSQAQILALYLIKYISENNKFFLTVNYAKDPFGIPFPNYNNVYVGKMLDSELNSGQGFIYNKMLRGGRNVAVGHSLYWMKTDSFTKDVVKSYIEGYNNFYQIPQK